MYDLCFVGLENESFLHRWAFWVTSDFLFSGSDFWLRLREKIVSGKNRQEVKRWRYCDCTSLQQEAADDAWSFHNKLSDGAGAGGEVVREQKLKFFVTSVQIMNNLWPLSNRHVCRKHRQKVTLELQISNCFYLHSALLILLLQMKFACQEYKMYCIQYII